MAFVNLAYAQGGGPSGSFATAEFCGGIEVQNQIGKIIEFIDGDMFTMFLFLLGLLSLMGFKFEKKISRRWCFYPFVTLFLIQYFTHFLFYLDSYR